MQDEAKKEQKNKNVTTEREKQSKQLSYIINLPRAGFWPPRGSLMTPTTPGCARMWNRFQVWSVTVSSCNRTEHLLDAVRQGQETGDKVNKEKVT